MTVLEFGVQVAPVEVRIGGTRDGESATPPPATDWMDDANCKGQTVLFFPHRAERPQARERREAKARRLCMSCNVLEQCRSYARQNHEYGYWAGESEEDRHLLGFTVSAPIGIRARAVGH